MRKQSAPELITIADVERLNSRTGKHFFDADTMRFFKSRIAYDYDLLYRRFFITTEKDGDRPRRASLRAALDDGSIETVGEFGEFTSPAQADRVLKREITVGRVSVRNDPYEGDKEPENVERFNWRCYVGELPVGSRTTQADALAIARQLYPLRFNYAASRHARVFHREIPIIEPGSTGAAPACGARYTAAITGPLNHEWRRKIEAGEGTSQYRPLAPCPRCFPNGEAV